MIDAKSVSTTALPGRFSSEVVNFWRRDLAVARAGYTVGAALIASGLVHLAILIVSGASWSGPLSWRKPATFGLSFGLTVMTITWVTSFLRLEDRSRCRLLAAFAITSVVETALVSLQTWRGVLSHFNLETTFDAVVARLLAVGGRTLIGIIAAFTVMSFRAHPAIPIHLRVAIRVGFLSLCASLLIGAAMIAKGMVLVISGHPQAAYAAGGVLKPSHAVLMHGILVLPLFAWFLTLTNWSERRQLNATLLAAGGYVLVAALTVTLNILRLTPQLPLAR